MKITGLHFGKLYVSLGVTEQNQALLLHAGRSPLRSGELPEKQRNAFRLAEVQFAGENQDDHHGSKYTGTLPGSRLVFSSLEKRDEGGTHLTEIVQRDPETGVTVVSRLRFFDGCGALESETEVKNTSEEPVTLTYVSSFALGGLTKGALSPWDSAALLKLPSNCWCGENQWRDCTLHSLGMHRCVSGASTQRFSAEAHGTWSSQEHLPMGFVQNRETGEGCLFSIAADCSWQWELDELCGQLCLRLSGPNENEGHWSKTLQPGESFLSVPAAAAFTETGFDDAAAELTRWRRLRRRPNADDRNLPVIFNDYMNCLNADPTEEKEYPLIEAAARAGCEYYVIDAGWYADGGWWSTVGEWLPCARRFSHGIGNLLAFIRSKGMVPGLWLELEVMGVQCPLAETMDDDCFFLRHGRRVIDHGRYQLDYRNPKVRAFADEVVDRLVKDYGVGYIKMDYNIDAGIGTEAHSDSPGDGLLGHSRSYLDWLRGVFARFPELVIENCSSGGLRVNDAVLRECSIQSSSDQTDFLKYASIAAAAPAAVPPEQCAVWSYPLSDADAEQTAFNMVNAMLMRIHQSGHLARLSETSFALVREALECYKSYRGTIPESVPFWPLGLPTLESGWAVLGLRHGDEIRLAVWRIDSAEQRLTIPLSSAGRAFQSAGLLYPKALPCRHLLSPDGSLFTAEQPPRSARLYLLK